MNKGPPGVDSQFGGQGEQPDAIAVDAVALFAAALIAVVAALLTLRGHRAGLVQGFIPATFTAYMAPQYLVGPDYLRLPGTTNSSCCYISGCSSCRSQ